MHLVDQHRLDRYLETDTVQRMFDAHSRGGDEALVCQRWLVQTPAKRLIFDDLYGDLFDCTQPLRVLDVGGGLTALTRVLAKRHRYRLADLLAHDDSLSANAMMDEVGSRFVHADDWLTLPDDRYDVVIANDLFPNVDQRLDMFLRKFLPQTRRMRLSLTYYDTPRYYKTRRVDADEILHMLAWDGAQLRATMERHLASVVDADLELFANPRPSLFPNGRQVFVVECQGTIRTEGAP